VRSPPPACGGLHAPPTSQTAVGTTGKSNDMSESDYQPIENHGVIGDLHSVALVGQNGAIDFLCFSDFDSPSVFAALLDSDKGGHFSLTPEVEGLRSRQMYLPDTNVLLTRFLCRQGVGELSDFMPVDE